MLEGWKFSKGAIGEQESAFNNGITIYYEEDGYDIPLHPTEVNNPVQRESFINQIMKMYRVHLKKNRDYSQANVLGTGKIGIIVRLWDKMARLMNLTGFNIEIKKSEFVAPKEPQNESIEDTFDDLAVYGVIAKLLYNNQWGK